MPLSPDNTETGICNAALTAISSNVKLVDVATDQNFTAHTCRHWYPIIREQMLRDHDWNFASVKAEVSADGAAPIYGPGKRYALPADCLHVRSVDGESRSDRWNIVGAFIEGDFGDPVRLRFTRDVTSPAEFDPMFRSAFVYSLAAALSIPLLTDERRAQMMGQMASDQITRGAMADSHEGFGESLQDEGWAQARHQGSRVPYR